MHINSFNSSNSIKCQGCKPSFTSVLPVRVFIDRVESANPEHISKVIAKFNNVLKGPAAKKPSDLNIIQKYSRIVKDYCYESGFLGFNKTQVVTRNYVDEKSAYIFTGPHANMINELGKRIGPAKAQAKCRLGGVNSFEVQAMTRNYFNKMREFIANSKIRILATFNPEKPPQEVGIIISAKSSGEYGTKKFKLEVEDIFFEPVKKP